MSEWISQPRYWNSKELLSSITQPLCERELSTKNWPYDDVMTSYTLLCYSTANSATLFNTSLKLNLRRRTSVDWHKAKTTRHPKNRVRPPRWWEDNRTGKKNNQEKNHILKPTLTSFLFHKNTLMKILVVPVQIIHRLIIFRILLWKWWSIHALIKLPSRITFRSELKLNLITSFF